MDTIPIQGILTSSTLAERTSFTLFAYLPIRNISYKPLDVAFISPFKTYYATEIETWLKGNPGRVVTAYQIGELMGKAYLRAASCEVAVNSFRACGIFPFQPNIFRDDEFAIHSSTETELVRSMSVAPAVTTVEHSWEEGEIIPTKSTAIDSLRNQMETTPPKSTSILVAPEDICPLPTYSKTRPNQSPQPSCPGIVSKKRGKRGSTAIITSTPYKNKLENSLKKKENSNPGKSFNNRK
nr:unnamed protein product [Callosobruchus chinensis]CAH7732287.1 unnamed protein product [Callosobruchus chinensis]